MFVLSRSQLIVWLLVVLLVTVTLAGGGRFHFADETALILLGLIAFLAQKREGFYRGRFSWEEGAAALFLLFSLAGVFWSDAPYVSFQFWLKILLWMGVFLLVRRLGFSKKEIGLLLKLLGGGAVLIGLWALGQYLMSSEARLAGPFFTANAFAGWLLLALSVTAINIFQSRDNREKGLWLVGAFFLAALLFLTGSRGAFLSLGGGLLLVAAFFVFKRKTAPAVGGFLLIGAALLAAQFLLATRGSGFEAERYVPDFLDKSEAVDQSIAARWDFWSGAGALFKQRPIQGFGLDTYRFHLPAVQNRPYVYSVYAHNFYLQLLAEGGLLAFTPLAALTVLIMVRIFLRARTGRRNQDILLLAGLGAASLHAGLDIDWHFLANPLFFWLMAGIAVDGKRKILPRSDHSREEKETTGQTRLKSALALILLLIIVLFSAHSVYSEIFYERGQLFIKLDKPQAAIHNFELARHPISNPLIERGLAQGYLRRALRYSAAEDWRRAERSAAAAISQEPANNINYELQGRIFLAEKKYNEAKQDLTRALALDHLNHLIYYATLGQASLLLGQVEEAEKQYAAGETVFKEALKAEARFPERIRQEAAELAYLKASIARSKGDAPGWQAALEQTLRRNPLHRGAKEDFKKIKREGRP